MLNEYHGKLTHHIQNAYLGVSGLERAFQGVKQPFFGLNPKKRATLEVTHRFE